MAEMCPDCGGEFATAAELVLHRRAGHPGHDATAPAPERERLKHPWVCGVCGSRFPSPFALAQHNLEPHPRLPGVAVPPAL